MTGQDKTATPVPCPTCNGSRVVHYSSWDDESPCPQCVDTPAAAVERLKGQTIRDLYEQCMAPVGNVVTSYVSTNHLLALLGLHADMPVETLRRQLLCGERVGRCVLVGGVVESDSRWWEDAGTYWQWLIEGDPDYTDSPVSP